MLLDKWKVEEYTHEMKTLNPGKEKHYQKLRKKVLLNKRMEDMEVLQKFRKNNK